MEQQQERKTCKKKMSMEEKKKFKHLQKHKCIKLTEEMVCYGISFENHPIYQK